MMRPSSTLTALNRRDFVRACASVPFGVALARSARAEDQGAASLQTTKLDENLFLISGAGGNVLLIVTPDGLGLIDGGLPDRSGELLRLVAELGHGLPVKVLFNTHWHLDHTGSNESLSRGGAKIIAHANTRKWLRTTVFIEMENRTYHPRPPQAIPTEIFYDWAKMTLGKMRVEYTHLPFGHTDGDISVFFPDSNVLVVGDVLAVGRYPVMDYSTGGWIGGLEEANSQLLEQTDAKTRIIAGAGGVRNKQDLQAHHEMIAGVKDRVVKLVRLGKGYSEIVAEAPTKDFDAQWGSSDQFLAMTYRGIMRNIREIGGII